jgi:hypothetical protein
MCNVDDYFVCRCSVCGFVQKFNIPTDNFAPKWMTGVDRAYAQAVSYGWTWKGGKAFCRFHEQVKKDRR